MAGKDELIYRAKLAEQAERYDDMMQLMKQMAELGVEITAEERNFYSFAYKNAIGIRRASWRSISEQEKKAEDSEKTLKLVAKDYREKIEKKCGTFAMKLWRLSRSISFQKPWILKATCCLCQSFRRCKEASTVQSDPNWPGSQLLGVLLRNLDSHGEACQLAQQAFDAASAELNSLPEESQRESWMILQLLRDNLTLWRAHEGSDGAKEESSDSDDDSTTDKNA
uniref:14-3-3 domain-containing protein n=1 Tax=Ditylenchus dipsaci TaxID=166011 RepID=A0A915E0Q1_9BILA